jgi:hypothetical protein
MVACEGGSESFYGPAIPAGKASLRRLVWRRPHLPAACRPYVPLPMRLTHGASRQPEGACGRQWRCCAARLRRRRRANGPGCQGALIGCHSQRPKPRSPRRMQVQGSNARGNVESNLSLDGHRLQRQGLVRSANQDVGAEAGGNRHFG